MMMITNDQEILEMTDFANYLIEIFKVIIRSLGD